MIERLITHSGGDTKLRSRLIDELAWLHKRMLADTSVSGAVVGIFKDAPDGVVQALFLLDDEDEDYDDCDEECEEDCDDEDRALASDDVSKANKFAVLLMRFINRCYSRWHGVMATDKIPTSWCTTVTV